MATIRVQKSGKRPGLNDMAKIREFFNVYDSDQNGSISMPELEQMLDKMGIKMTHESLTTFFQQIDIDKSGSIEFGEFVDWYTTLMELADEEAVKTLARLEQSTSFKRAELEAVYDNYKRVSASVVNDGMIDRQEFKQMMVAGGVPSWNSFLTDGLFSMFDADGSGSISFEEFVTILSIYHNKGKKGANEKHKLLFQIYDVDKDGKIGRTDLAKILSDCLACNNMILDDKDILALVDASFARAGCGTSMDLKAYLQEIAERGLE